MSAPTRFGLTWWGQRWIAALEALGSLYANRLPRGRTYARRGAVGNLDVRAGKVTAAVAGTRARPYQVTLGLPVFDDATWEAVIDTLAGELRYAADLLADEMPKDIDTAFQAHGVSLFPSARELRTRCSCPDSANPCKHVAAVHYVLAQRFDADPFLLPTLRGRDRAALLGALRARRAGVEVAVDDPDDDVEVVALEALTARALFTAAGDLDTITVRPRPPVEPTATLRRLGPPPGLAGIDAALGGLVEAAATTAWELVDGEADLLLSALLQLDAATSRQLAEVLDQPVDEVRARLRALRDDGRVVTTGRGAGTRYHLRR